MSKYDYLHYFHFYFTNNLVNQHGLTFEEIIQIVEENQMISIIKRCLKLSQNTTYLDLVME
jgi:hypothetical protein